MDSTVRKALEASDVHASRPVIVVFNQPDAEASRGEVGGDRRPKDNGVGEVTIITHVRPRTARAVIVELAPLLAIEGFEHPF